MSGFYLRGALVEFIPTPLIPLPNVIIFQYNPETMSHSWTQPPPASAGPNEKKANPMAVTGDPGESFSFTLQLDAHDSIAGGGAAGGLASISGVYPRLAAIEMLLYPAASASSTGGLVGMVSAALGGSGGGKKRRVPANVINPVLFVWGPGRIVPVRVTGLTVTEKLYDSVLNPTKAEAQITLRVLAKDELDASRGLLHGPSKTASAYTHSLRQALALANLVNSGDSIVGMLPV
jgi:hypothetical protein